MNWTDSLSACLPCNALPCNVVLEWLSWQQVYIPGVYVVSVSISTQSVACILQWQRQSIATDKTLLCKAAAASKRQSGVTTSKECSKAAMPLQSSSECAAAASCKSQQEADLRLTMCALQGQYQATGRLCWEMLLMRAAIRPALASHSLAMLLVARYPHQ